jgi:hypothetical protein
VDVGRLDVAVDHARCARSPALADLDQDAAALGQRDRRFAVDQVAQVVALEQLHRHVELAVGVAQVVDGDDVGVVQAADGFGLALEALMQLVLVGQHRREHLEGHHTAQALVPGAVNHTHGALAQLVEDLVPAEAGHATPRNGRSPPRRCPCRRLVCGVDQLPAAS